MGGLIMAELDENLDLLDLEEDTDLESFPESNPFGAPRPKKPWLLLGLGLIVIALATYIIIRSVGSDSSSSVDIDLDTPTVVETTGVDAASTGLNPVTAPLVVPDQKAEEIKQNDATGVPVRAIEDRKPVEFNSQKAEVIKPAASVAQPKKPAPVAEKSISKQVSSGNTQTVKKTGSWYVQFGSYSTRALAERAQNKIRGSHEGLFAGKQFVILAAVLPDGKTTYRLRVAFEKSDAANGFCQNAKSDGLECYVAK